MQLFNSERRSGPSRYSFRLLLAAAGAIMLLAGFSSTAAAKPPSIETVNVSASTFNFEVHPQGGFVGNNNITFQVSREEKPRGVTQRCRKIKYVSAIHLEPGSQVLGNSQYDYRVGTAQLKKPLCNFTDLELTGRPFRDQDINSVCFETPRRSTPGAQVPTGPPVFIPGKSAILDKEIRLDFVQTLGSFIYGRRVPEKKLVLRANIQCVDNTVSGGTQGTPSVGVGSGRFTPRDPRIGQGASAGSTGTTGGSTQCDLTGTWYGYNNGTQTTGWKFDQIFTAGGSSTYRAIHLSTQGTPTGGEGAITRSPSGNYLFNTLATSIPGARGAYQASTMRIYDADASCSKLTERQLYDSTSGMVNRPGNYWLQRASAPPRPVPSPVGRPTGPTNTFRPRTAPTKPGDTFQPGPNTPKPGPTLPAWNKR